MMTRVYLESYTSYLSTYVATQDSTKPDGMYVCCVQWEDILKLSMPFVHFNCSVRYFVLQGMPYSLVKFTGAPDAQCLQGMPYSPVKFTRAPDARCLQGGACVCYLYQSLHKVHTYKRTYACASMTSHNRGHTQTAT